MVMPAKEYSSRATLRDGRVVRIRSIRPNDKQRLQRFHGKLSEQSVYHRFFELKERLDDRDLCYLTEVDAEQHVALVATTRKWLRQEIVAVARYVRSQAQGPTRHADVAFTVNDHYQGKGLGTALFRHLAAIAIAQNVEVFEAQVLGENRAMMKVFEQSGYPITSEITSGVVSVSLQLQSAPTIERAAEGEVQS
jgi:GNAT superfamily N-acetyltransferase